MELLRQKLLGAAVGEFVKLGHGLEIIRNVLHERAPDIFLGDGVVLESGLAIGLGELFPDLFVKPPVRLHAVLRLIGRKGLQDVRSASGIDQTWRESCPVEQHLKLQHERCPAGGSRGVARDGCLIDRIGRKAWRAASLRF